jgi:hypothetical protein
MALTLRLTGLSSPAHADRLDCVVVDDGRIAGLNPNAAIKAMALCHLGADHLFWLNPPYWGG